MITKEEFTEYILNYQAFEQAVSRMEEAFCGRLHGCDLFECDWVNSVDKMLDIFIESHFTETGSDWVYYYLFENIDDKKVVIEVEDMFGIEEKEYHLNNIDELWEFLLTDKKIYFKNAE